MASIGARVRFQAKPVTPGAGQLAPLRMAESVRQGGQPYEKIRFRTLKVPCRNPSLGATLQKIYTIKTGNCLAARGSELASIKCRQSAVRVADPPLMMPARSRRSGGMRPSVEWP